MQEFKQRLTDLIERLRTNYDSVWEDVQKRKKIYIDFETYSECDILTAGAWVYSKHPSTEILCMAYAFEDGPTQIWVPGINREPDFLREDKNYQFHAYNTSFEQSVWENIIVKRMGGVPLPPDRWYDTMSKVAAHALPLALDKAGAALKVDCLKDPEGKRTMQQLSKPRTRTSVARPETRFMRGVCEEWDAKFAQLEAYCINDVDAEKAIDAKLPCIGKEEWYVWLFNQITNLIGIRIDRKAVQASLRIFNEFKGWADGKASEVTNGEVDSMRQVARFKIWLALQYPNFIKPSHAKAMLEYMTREPLVKSAATQLSVTPRSDRDTILALISRAHEDVAILAQTLFLAYKDEKTKASPLSLNKEAIAELLTRQDVPQEVREALELRQDAGKASVSKIMAMEAGADPEDDHVRWALQYHAASTGREGGRLVQPQNMSKPTSHLLSLGRKAHNLTEEQDPIPYIIEDIKTKTLEELIELYESPMQAISGALRGFIQTAPEHEIISADYNAIEARIVFWYAGAESALQGYKENRDLYCGMASTIYGKPCTKKDTPKERDLGKASILGCGFGMGAPKFLATCKKQGLDISEELARKAVATYRNSYPEVPALWREVERAAINALYTKTPQSFGAGRFEYDQQLDFLYLVLPSGRKLAYAEPRIIKTEGFGGKKVSAPSFLGVNSVTKKFTREKTWGGTLVENLVQATARDVMVRGVQNAFLSGYSIFMTVHDELVSRVNKGQGDVADFERLLTQGLPEWAATIPLSAEGWRDTRYKK